MKKGEPSHLAKTNAKYGVAPYFMTNYYLSDKVASPVTFVLSPLPCSGKNHHLSIEN